MGESMLRIRIVVLGVSGVSRGDFLGGIVMSCSCPFFTAVR